MIAGVVSGALAIGGMEIGAARLARLLIDAGYDVWIAYNDLQNVNDHEIGVFLAEEGITDNFVPWAEIKDWLAQTEVVWASQAGFLDNQHEVCDAMNAVSWRFEYNGQPANVVPEYQRFVPTWQVVKTKSLTREMRERRKDNIVGFLTIPGIPAHVPEELNRAPIDPPTFFTMARFVHWQKRLCILVNAAHLLAQRGYKFRVVIAGDGPDKDQLVKLARGVHYIEFPGWVKGEERARLARESFAYVMPSSWEGSSRALREMMALGVPLISGRGGGTPELVRDGIDALLMDVSGNHNENLGRDARVLADLMAQLLDNPALAAELATNARARIVELNECATRAITKWMAAIRDKRILPVGTVDVSVIIPAYNAEDTLRATVESVLRQTDAPGKPCPRFEIVIVDDGSTDGTGTLADELAAQDERIHVIHQPNRGVNAARNRAALAACGTALLPLDADDELLGELDDKGNCTAYTWLAHAWDTYVQSGGECLVYGRIVRFVSPESKQGQVVTDDKGKTIYKIIRPPTFIDDVKALVGAYEGRTKTLLPTVLHPRQAWVDVGGWGWEGGKEGRGLEDSAYNIECILSGYTLVYVADIYYHWRYREGSRSNEMDFRQEWAALAKHYKPVLEGQYV